MTLRRKLIKDNLDTVFAAITVVGGYKSTVGKVERAVRHFDDPNAAPRPFIGYAAGVRESFEYTCSDLAYVTTEFMLVAYVEGATQDGADNALDAMWDDIVRALNQDQTRGANAIRTVITEVVTNEGEMFDGGIWIRALQMRFQVEWDRHLRTST